MSELTENSTELPKGRRRCPHCDSVVEPGANRCLMCGQFLDDVEAVPYQPVEPLRRETLASPVERPVDKADREPGDTVRREPGDTVRREPADTVRREPADTVRREPADTVRREPADTAVPVIPTQPEPQPIPDVVESVMREREAPVTFWLTAVFAIIIIVLGALVLRFQGEGVTLALVPSPTPILPTATYTPTWTPLPTDFMLPIEETLAATAEFVPTPTLQPPQPHTVSAGETLIGLALRYRVSVDSIAELNGIAADSSLLVNQGLLIPLPTATPPLVPVANLINGETVIADPTDCEKYQIQSGDSLSGVAARYDVDFALFLLVNRLTVDSIPQPGDVLCIPEIVYGGSLPPTPGPSPTPTVTSLPPGPQLLYPVANAEIQPPDSLVTLQWTAVKNLADDEWYMVELTDLDNVDGLPYRGFTRDTAFHLPGSWRPAVEEETHTLQWRVSIVQVNGRRADGMPIYVYGGQASVPAYFSWEGAVPTPTPQPTATPLPEES